jgi:hypothetical protein
VDVRASSALRMWWFISAGPARVGATMATTPSDKGPSYDVHLVSALRELIPRLSIHR